MLGSQKSVLYFVVVAVCNQETQPLISGIEQSFLALVSAYYSLPSAQGQTLRRLLADSVVSLTSSMQCLLRALDSRSEGQRFV